MIVKSMARKSVSFAQLLAYVNKPEELTPAWLFNFSSVSDDPPAVVREFLDNCRYLPSRRGGNVLYHEILSFGAGDREQVTPEILEDLAREYVQRRAPTALVYAKPHLTTAAPHVHILISANPLGESRRHRLSRGAFGRIKRDIELLQRRRYPALVHSVVEAKRGRGLSRRESERERRLEKAERTSPSLLDQTRRAIAAQLSQADSLESFALRLRLLGLEVYVRGRHSGVIDSKTLRRHRFRTLGLDRAFSAALVRWHTLTNRKQALASLRRDQRRFRERDSTRTVNLRREP